MHDGYFQVITYPVSTYVHQCFELRAEHLPPLGTKQNEPSEKTALFSAAKKLSFVGTTEPRYFRTRSGCSRIASVKEQKITPCFFSFSLYVVATDTESKIASTATPASCFCSVN